jgi:hypothetical protein
MGISNSNPDLFRAILAMDAYNRGYNAGMGDPISGLGGTRIGIATLRNEALPVGSETASFFAKAYQLDNGPTIISYRGTDDHLFPAKPTAKFQSQFIQSLTLSGTVSSAASTN